MDAYDLSNKIKDVWIKHSDKKSGIMSKKIPSMPVVVATEDGYREVIGVFWNNELNKIELVLDTE